MLTTTTLFLKLQKFLERLYTYDLFNQHTHHRYFHAIFPKVEIGNFFWTPFTDSFFRSFNYFFSKTKITINHKHSSDTGMLLQVLELPNLFAWNCPSHNFVIKLKTRLPYQLFPLWLKEQKCDLSIKWT